MRCIENHPTRNSLMGTTVVNTSTRTLQLKIESLKKELAMRDLMCGYAMYSSVGVGVGGLHHTSLESDGITNPNTPPILDTLTKPQFDSCQKMTHRFVISGSEKDIDVRSLAEVKAMATILRSALWNACGDDQTTVIQVLKEMGSNMKDFEQEPKLSPKFSQSTTIGGSGGGGGNGGNEGRQRVGFHTNQIDKINEDGGDDDDNEGNENNEEDNENVNKIKQDKEYLRQSDNEESFSPPQVTYTQKSPTKLKIPSTIVSSSPATITTPVGLVSQDMMDDIDENQENSGNDPFSLFKQSEGRILHESYEELKQQLKEAKIKQKTLVKQVNQTKVEIDSLTTLLQTTINQQTSSPRNGENEIDYSVPSELSPRQKSQEEINHQINLQQLKSTYKQARNDLIYCKEEIVDLNRKKQLALNALVSGYEQFVSNEKKLNKKINNGSDNNNNNE